jgi:hypothetical protein
MAAITDDGFKWVAVYEHRCPGRSERREQPFKSSHDRDAAEKHAKEIVSGLPSENRFIALTTGKVGVSQQK